MKRELARCYADSLALQMSPYVERIEIVGSIRRMKPEVRDIELLVVAKWEEIAADGVLFDEAVTVNRLHDWAIGPDCRVRWIKAGTSEIVDWEPKPGGHYWRGLLSCEIKLDVFLCEENNWGLHKLIRTGSKDFSKAVVTRAADVGLPCKGGWLWHDDTKVVSRSEMDVVRALNLAYVEPRARQDKHSLRTVSR